MCGRRFKIWVLVAVLLQPITSDEATENSKKLMDSAKDVMTTNSQFINTPEITKNIEATDITERIQFKDTTKNDQITGTEKKIQVEGSNDYNDLFTMENIALELPVRSAVHALNMKLLKEMLLKKLTAKFGKHATKK